MDARPLFFALMCGAISPCIAAQHPVEGRVPGRCFNPLQKTWEEAPIRAWVDDDGSTYLQAGEGSERVTTYVSDKERAGLIAVLKKGLDLIDKTKEETSTDLGAFLKKGSRHEFGMKFRFILAKSDPPSHLMLTITDMESAASLEVRLDPDQVYLFVTLLEKAGETLRALKDQAQQPSFED